MREKEREKGVQVALRRKSVRRTTDNWFWQEKSGDKKVYYTQRKDFQANIGQN